MAITVKHSKVSTIPDEADTSLVRPSDWNADHTLTGTIDIANGGTGQTTANAAFNALVPSQTGNTGKYLTTNGTDTSWATVSGGSGTVTSVAATAGTGISVTGSPITTSGTLNITNTAPDQTVVLNSGTGISTSGTYPNFTVTNTAPDQTVSIASGTGISTSGTYPAFTVTNTGVTSAVAGTGISVSSGTGAVTVTNTAPDQTVVLNAGTGISTSGTYPNFTITNTSPSLGGDVVGPASATDNAIARYDTTTGKLIQNSTVTINDNGTLEAVNGIAFDTTPTSAPTAEGSLSWNSSDGTLDLVMKGGNVVQQIGEKQYYTVRNETGSTIANGTPVMANGVTSGSGRITVTPAIANGSIDELRFIGLTTESITSGINGYVTSFGYVRGLDTRGTPYGETWAEGDFIYVSPTTAGYLTNVEPTAPNLKIVVAIVITRNQTSGVLLVRPTAYPHITHLSDVNILSPTSGNLLIYDAPQNRWENADLTASTGISVTNGAGSVTITNTAPDQVVSLTGAGTTSISGTYPNFTVTSNDQFTGTVTSVTGTAPVVSSGGNTPAISMAAATGSVNGYLTSTDWTTFNNKGSGTVTSVSGTGTVSGISLSGTVTTSGNLTLGGTLDLSSPPAIGGTAPNTVAATTITASTSIMPAADNTGVIGDATTTWSNGQFTSLTIDSTLNVRAAIDLADSDVLRMGSSDDWQIFYNGTTNKANVELESACLAISYTDNGTEIASLEKSTGTYTAKQLTASNGIVTNSKTIGTSFTIPSTDNASSAGPITIASGVTVTVSSGSRWVVS